VSTNLNLSLTNVHTPAIKSLINVVVAIPDAIRNPTAAVGSLLGGMMGGAKQEKGGWVDELMKSPINALVAHGTAGSGKIELAQAYLESQGFRGQAAGTIEIANVLSHSVIQFPVTVSLSKNLSDRVGLTPTGTPTNAVFVALPDFVKMKGTLGQPKPDVNYLKLAQMALKSSGGILGNIGGAGLNKAGGAVGTVEGMLGVGTHAAATNADGTASTNAPAPKAEEQILRGLGGLLGGKKKSTATNAPAPQPKP
jgi:hypothetical protein